MLNLRILKDLIAYIIAVIIWIPTRTLSIIVQLFNLLCVEIIMKRWRLISLLFIITILAVPQIQGANLFFGDGHIINIPRIIQYYSFFFKSTKDIITIIVILVIEGFLISKVIILFFGNIVLDISMFIHDKLITVSKYWTRRRLVILERDFRAKRDGGLYNIEAFKKKYMY